MFGGEFSGGGAVTEVQWAEIKALVANTDGVPKHCFTCDFLVDEACTSDVLNAYRTERFKPSPTWYCAEYRPPEGLTRVEAHAG